MAGEITRDRRDAWAARRTIAISRVDDPADLRRLLAAEGANAAYHLSYLQPDRLGRLRAYAARLEERHALAVHSRGGLGAATLLAGDEKLVAALLRLHPGPRHTLLTCDPDYAQTALSVYHLWRPQVMLRMQLDPAAFAPPDTPMPLRPLGRDDARDLNRLYALEGDGIWYSSRQIEDGLYFGADVRGQIVAAAGTHTYSTSEGVAVVGNVFTHPDFRIRGLATAVTAAVTAHLVESCRLIVLNVDPANRGARRVYERLGYRETGRVLEAMATRRYPYSPLPLLDRLLARRRGATPGVEIIPA